MQNTYEVTLIARASFPEADEKKLLESIKAGVKEGGKVSEVKKWGVKPFAYPIQKEKEGTYIHITLEAAGASIPSLSQTLRLNEKILRFLILKKNSLKKE